LRPAVALANVGRDDWILCQVTTSAYGDPHAIELTTAKLARSSLHSRSYVRPGKLFTASRSLMVAEIGMLQLHAGRDLVNAVISILQASVS